MKTLLYNFQFKKYKEFLKQAIFFKTNLLIANNRMLHTFTGRWSFAWSSCYMPELSRRNFKEQCFTKLSCWKSCQRVAKRMSGIYVVSDILYKQFGKLKNISESLSYVRLYLQICSMKVKKIYILMYVSVEKNFLSFRNKFLIVLQSRVSPIFSGSPRETRVWGTHD